MKMVKLGRTGLSVPQLAFGALPIQRTDKSEAVRILRAAYDGGIRFFDTARAYSDSEEKIGAALSAVRKDIVIATKTTAVDAKTAAEHLEMSLSNMKTGYIDIIQLHTPERMPDPGDENSAYAELVRAKKAGKVRFIGMTNHRAHVAREAVESGLFDTLQFPMSHISSQSDLSLVDLCVSHNVGFIAMKALCGGLITDIPAAFSFFRRYDHVVPIWGIQRMRELEEFLALEKNPPVPDEALLSAIDRDRRELASSFCRGCGYCLPCPAGIPIPMSARISFLLRRAPYAQFLTPEWKEMMGRIKSCVNCGSCKAKCPYNLDTPALLREMLADYEEFARTH